MLYNPVLRVITSKIGALLGTEAGDIRLQFRTPSAVGLAGSQLQWNAVRLARWPARLMAANYYVVDPS